VHLPLGSLGPDQRRAALAQLGGFAEDRYLHQTMVRDRGGERFFEDLPGALALGAEHDGELRVHFHVPIYLESFGLLRTSRPQILECLAALPRLSACRHFEVETYAWGVLPEALRQPDLATGIAAELRWFADVLSSSA
jgi:hypothetical protein